MIITRKKHETNTSFEFFANCAEVMCVTSVTSLTRNEPPTHVHASHKAVCTLTSMLVYTSTQRYTT